MRTFGARKKNVGKGEEEDEQATSASQCLPSLARDPNALQPSFFFHKTQQASSPHSAMSAAVPIEKSLIDGDAGIRGVAGALLFEVVESAPTPDERWDRRRMRELIV